MQRFSDIKTNDVRWNELAKESYVPPYFMCELVSLFSGFSHAGLWCIGPVDLFCAMLSHSLLFPVMEKRNKIGLSS